MKDLLKLSGLDNQVGFLLRFAAAAAWSDLVATLDGAQLKPQAYATLAIIGAAGTCKQQDVADALGIQRPNFVAMVETLVGRNLISRQTNAVDRRSYALELTEEGRKLLARAEELHAAHERKMAEAFDICDATQFLDALRHLGGLSDPTGD